MYPVFDIIVLNAGALVYIFFFPDTDPLWPFIVGYGSALFVQHIEKLLQQGEGKATSKLLAHLSKPLKRKIDI